MMQRYEDHGERAGTRYLADTVSLARYVAFLILLVAASSSCARSLPCSTPTSTAAIAEPADPIVTAAHRESSPAMEPDTPDLVEAPEPARIRPSAPTMRSVEVDHRGVIPRRNDRHASARGPPLRSA